MTTETASLTASQETRLDARIKTVRQTAEQIGRHEFKEWDWNNDGDLASTCPRCKLVVTVSPELDRTPIMYSRPDKGAWEGGAGKCPGKQAR